MTAWVSLMLATFIKDFVCLFFGSWHFLTVLVPEVTSVPTNLRGIGSRLSWSFADTGLDMEAPGDLRSKLMGQQVNSDYSFVFFEAN